MGEASGAFPLATPPDWFWLCRAKPCRRNIRDVDFEHLIHSLGKKISVESSMFSESDHGV